MRPFIIIILVILVISCQKSSINTKWEPLSEEEKKDIFTNNRINHIQKYKVVEELKYGLAIYSVLLEEKWLNNEGDIIWELKNHIRDDGEIYNISIDWYYDNSVISFSYDSSGSPKNANMLLEYDGVEYNAGSNLPIIYKSYYNKKGVMILHYKRTGEYEFYTHIDWSNDTVCYKKIINTNNNVEGHYKEIYNSHGDEIESHNLLDDVDLPTLHKYVYDSIGNKIESLSTSHYRHRPHNTRWTSIYKWQRFYEGNQLIEERRYSFSSIFGMTTNYELKLDKRTTYEYDQYGNETRYISYNEDGSTSLEIVTEIEYDVMGNKLKEITYGDGEIWDEIKYSYENNELIKKTNYDLSENITESVLYKYNIFGLIIQEEFSASNTSEVWYNRYFYNHEVVPKNITELPHASAELAYFIK